MNEAITVEDLFPDDMESHYRLGEGIVERYMPSCGEVARILVDVMVGRGMDIETLSASSSVPISEVERFCEDGKGDIEDFFKILGALKIKPVAIPCLSELGK